MCFKPKRQSFEATFFLAVAYHTEPPSFPCVIHKTKIQAFCSNVVGSVRESRILMLKSLFFFWPLWRFKFKWKRPVNRLLTHWESHTPLSPSLSESSTPPMIMANYNDECTPVRKRLNPVVVHARSLLLLPPACCDLSAKRTEARMARPFAKEKMQITYEKTNI